MIGRAESLRDRQRLQPGDTIDTEGRLGANKDGTGWVRLKDVWKDQEQLPREDQTNWYAKVGPNGPTFKHVDSAPPGKYMRRPPRTYSSGHSDPCKDGPSYACGH
eukprot:gnl/TRDRNA2_/TRDRNA2_167960_c0_seq4.p1 gnl/TRDRNA2_/TRDRNA2_167960_c0~~gnl/TRDRNA2_/TRDRNA2_167960_c0_seq4.p1  ORF type:complete len:105 (-),score=11.15 gnl/TRDRNA2_/TRDRNA2_167960_c0_seq4:638-952(-)